MVADDISVSNEDAILRGHGTNEMDGRMVATICGVVERVNKLVYVRALRASYKPEIGDIIVVRVVEVAPKRWRLEINFSQDAVLMLSSMNLPDGIKAEVCGFQHDGCLHLQARSQKYGKLNSGQLHSIPPYLVKKRKQHFHQYGVDLILGCNGFIWVGEHVEVRDDMVEGLSNKSEQQNMKSWDMINDEETEETYTPFETRQHICRTANAIRVLSTLSFMITVENTMEVINLSIALNVDIHEMLARSSMLSLLRKNFPLLIDMERIFGLAPDTVNGCRSLCESHPSCRVAGPVRQRLISLHLIHQTTKQTHLDNSRRLGTQI